MVNMRVSKWFVGGIGIFVLVVIAFFVLTQMGGAENQPSEVARQQEDTTILQQTERENTASEQKTGVTSGESESPVEVGIEDDEASVDTDDADSTNSDNSDSSADSVKGNDTDNNPAEFIQPEVISVLPAGASANTETAGSASNAENTPALPVPQEPIPDDIPLIDPVNRDSDEKGNVGTAEKPTVPNLSSNLDQLFDIWGSDGDAGNFADTNGIELENGRVKVMIVAADAKSGAAVVDSIARIQGEVIAHFDQWVDAWIPVENLGELADLPGIVSIQLPIPANPSDVGSAAPQESAVLVGTFNSQGVAASNASAWHTSGITGTGVKVAVLDTFKDYTLAQAAGELPTPISTHGTINTSTSRHGTAVAEIIYDMAPGAQFTFASPSSATQMAQYITELAAAGNKVICSSIAFYSTGPGDGTGPLSTAIATAYNTYGTLFIQAAGNNALSHWDGVFADGNTNNFHDFATNVEYNPISFSVPAGYTLDIYLRWNDWNLSDQDYDLYLYRWDGAAWGSPVAFSANEQGSGSLGLPSEFISYPVTVAGTYAVRIHKFNADGTHVLDLVVASRYSALAVFPLTYRVQDRSLVDAATGTLAIGVSAVNPTDPYALKDFSSWGPAHGAGGGLSGGNSQPRIAGYSDVDTWSYGVSGFSGTSAAAPHVAGAAALLFSLNPTYSPGDVLTFLETRSIDMGDAGYDFKFGTGRLHLGSPAFEASPNTNLIVNGDFGNNEVAWNFWGEVTHSVNGSQELKFYRQSPSPSGASVYQITNYSAQGGWAFEATLDLANISSVEKSVQVLLHAGNWSEVLACNFTLPANTLIAGTYTLRGKSVAVWNKVAVTVSPLNADGLSAVVMDNVNVQYKPSLGVTSTECLTPDLADQNLITNGGFSAGEDGWGFWGEVSHQPTSGHLRFYRQSPSPTGASIYQITNHAAQANWSFEVTLDLGNNSSSAKNIQVVLHAWDWAQYFVCDFSIPAGASLDTYTMRAKTTTPWTKVVFSIYALDADNLPNILIDNVNVEYKPSQDFSTQQCLKADISDLNLVTNGAFENGEAAWNFWGDIVHTVNTGTMEAYRPVVSPNGASFYQTIPHAAQAGWTFEVTADFGNTNSSTKTVQVVLHAPSWSEYFVCNFVLFGDSPLQTYTLHGKTSVGWNQIGVSISILEADDLPAVLVDNVGVQYKPALNVTTTECLIPNIANQNLIGNGGFDNGETAWNFWGEVVHQAPAGELEFHRPVVSPNGASIYQIIPYAAQANWSFEVKLDLGNTSTVEKNVQVLLHSSTWNQVLSCSFTIPPETAADTHTMRAKATVPWDGIAFTISVVDADDLPSIIMDNVDVQYKPLLNPSTTICLLPGETTQNLLLNGNFNMGEQSWNFWGEISHVVNNNQLEVYRQLSSPNGASIYQQLTVSQQAGFPFEITIDFANSSNVEKNISVILHAGDFTEFKYCSFRLPPNSPMNSYILRGKSQSFWSTTWLTINLTNADGLPQIEMDNATAYHIPGLVLDTVECIDPFTGDNLIANGDFSNGETAWNFWGDVSPNVNGSQQLEFYANAPGASVYQVTNNPTLANQPYEALFDLANTSGVTKNVQVLMHSSDWVDIFACNFALPPGASMATYTLRAKPSFAWTQLALTIIPQDADSTPAIVLDNVNVQHKPSLGGISGTTCIYPATVPEDTELISNNVFNNGEDDWEFLNINHTLSEGAIIFWATVSQTDNAIYQDIPHSLGSGAKMRFSVQIANPSESNIQFTIAIEDVGNAESLSCTFEIPSGTGATEFTVRGISTTGWSGIRVRVTDDTTGYEHIQLDNTSAMYDSDMVISETCSPPGFLPE